MNLFIMLISLFAVREARTHRRKSPAAVRMKQLKITTLHGTGVLRT